MRDPKLDMESRFPNRSTSELKGPQGREHRVAFGLDMNGYAPRAAETNESTSAPDEGSGGLVDRQMNGLARPKTAAGLNATTYDELHRAQTTGEAGPNGNMSNGNSLRYGRPPAPLLRAKSDYGPRRGSEKGAHGSDDEESQMRHGWEDEYTSSEYLALLNSAFYMYFTDKRHETSGIPKDPSGVWPNQDWRMKDRLKTVSAALAICLNIGVDPPDVVKTNPTAKLECWVDPTSTTGGQNKIMEQIGKKLQEQYETLSLRTRYKQYLDPSVDETKKFCISLRRNAKDERVLFHYNGHGVPLPTQSGELWVFNKNYTQYIPVPLYDLQSWLAGPSLFVYDVSHAGNIIHNFQAFVDKHEKENLEARKRDPQAPIQSYGDCIQLAACGRTETLPTNPDLPADLFTCCLTTPIDIALRFFILQNPLPSSLAVEEFRVPGRLQDRRSPLGELNWIFTAITDTIAWNILPRALFKKLFRQDLMVAALFRNFLLSERIMRANHCHPMSSPELPETHHHPLWQSWDLAIEMVLAQLPALIEHEEGKRQYEYQHSTFFAEQLTAFEVYLSQGPTEKNAPDQLPIVLQVLLSQAHRLRALILLSKFLDLGPWAVHLALSIGIFPYVVKLLQSAAQELKPVMVFIWARIMAVDHTVQSDLLKDNGIHYFITILNPNSGIPVGNASEHRAMCAFIVAIFCKNYPQGQTVCLSPDLFDACLKHLTDAENPLLRQWSCLCLSVLWYGFAEAKWMGIRCVAHSRLCDLVLDPVPEVRAAMLHALTNFIGIPDLTDQVAQIEESIASNVMFMSTDGSILVRKELLVFFSTFVKRYENKFTITAYDQMVEEKEVLLHPPIDISTAKANEMNGASKFEASARRQSRSRAISQNSVFASIWKQVLIMSVDPHPEIAQNAGIVVDYVHEALLQSPMGGLAQVVVDDVVRMSRRALIAKSQPSEPTEIPFKAPDTPPPQGAPKQQGYLSLSMRRTASVAASLKNLAFGGPASHETSPTSPQKNQLPKSPHTPNRVMNTPRGRAPAEWTRPPEVNDALTPTAAYHQAPTPVSRSFKARESQGHPNLPLKSKFLDWSTEVMSISICTIDKRFYKWWTRFLTHQQYFREPQMKPSEPDEPGSADYNQRLWRRSRNERIIGENQPLKEKAGTSRWDSTMGFLNNNSQPMKMCFHQFEDHLAVTDDRDTVCIWDWQRQARLNRFSNGNPFGSKINEARFINEDDQALLMIGSSDGVLKVFRNYESAKEVEVVTAFRALTDLVPSNRNAGLVFDWQQGQGKALVAGDVKVIKVWNAATEVCTNDIPARSGSCITSLTSDQVAGNIFIAGFGDGAVRVFDQRLKPTMAMVKVWREHKQWITNVHMQRGGVRELISGSRNGEIRLWDLRMDAPVGSIKALSSTRDTLRTLSVHEHAPIFAIGSDRHDVKTFNVNGAFLSSFEPYSSWALNTNRHTPIAATAYHPHRMLLACAALNDNHVNLLTC